MTAVRSLRIAVAALAVALTLAGCRTELHSRLTEREANEIVALLTTNGIDATRQVVDGELVSVFVDERQFSRAVEILKQEGYPRQDYANLGDVFQGNGFVVSQTEERARFVFALTEELSRTISEIDGVLSARTHVVLPTADPLARTSAPSSASVVIRHAAEANVAALLPQIKTMVANAIEGLEYRNVSVVFLPVTRRRTPPAETPPAPVASMLLTGPTAVPVAAALAAGAALGGLAAAGVAAWRRRAGRGLAVERAD
ncbi:MAG: type III secretion inner membrane ring lipoprotein SctJ [Rhodobacteraceae bacterium]|jgi:type III secretion protein J|nr:type III secretion inner membrane ring lipoprotein SctJ [Paracoccaceae bacterium]